MHYTWETLFPLWSKEQLLIAISLYKERATTVLAMMQSIQILYQHTAKVSQEDIKAWVTPETVEHLTELQKRLTTLDTYTIDSLKILLKDIGNQYAIKLVMLAQPVRLALTSTTASPGIFELMVLLGKQETIKRLQHFCAFSAVSFS